MTDKRFQWTGRRLNDPAHDMLAAFLVMDIQRNSEWAHELADRLEQVQAGKLPVWERLGNAYRVELSRRGARIEDLVDEESSVQRVSLIEFSEAVDAWIEALDN